MIQRLSRIFAAFLLIVGTMPSYAADNTVILTPGSGVTMRSVDVGSGVESSMVVLGSTTGTAIYGTAGTANANVITVQGIASGTAIPVSLASTTITGTVAATQSGSWTDTVTQSTAANLNATVVGTGTFAVQAAQSGTWTVQPGNTANTTPWLVTGSGTAGTAASGVITVQGIASMTKLLVTPDSVALPANQSVNVSQINGVTPLMGNGTTGTGSPRVTIASDNTAFSVNATLSAETTKNIGTIRVTGNVGGVLDAIGQNVAAPANWLQAGCQFQTTPTTITPGNGSPCQMDNAGNLLVKVNAPVVGLAQASTTSGQTGSLVMGAVTTAAPSYTTAQTDPLSLTTTGALRQDIASVNSVAILTGTGAVGTGAQRVAVGTDTATIAGSSPTTALAAVGAVATAAAPPANAVYLGANASGATGGHIAGLISCDSHVFKHITTATDTLAVQGVASQTIYVCSWRSRAAGVATWFLENTASTNANCSSANTQITGVATEAANTGETWGGNFWSGLKNTSANGLCINSTGTGGVDIDIWYAQL
jgi:hypothetical protein